MSLPNVCFTSACVDVFRDHASSLSSAVASGGRQRSSLVMAAAGAALAQTPQIMEPPPALEDQLLFGD